MVLQFTAVWILCYFHLTSEANYLRPATTSTLTPLQMTTVLLHFQTHLSHGNCIIPLSHQVKIIPVMSDMHQDTQIVGLAAPMNCVSLQQKRRLFALVLN
ncbi:hypothetical protein AVEN_27836-1 [Araneus ventricosus]|uniref:Secreted protein n=1 Tax=Araneus ventricosus TaxID=182803 RepID=A0A4Y2GRP1_ARAVE|nr:hypothetical protein AVEN_27836-1 [Araneus ventricosus]